MIDDTRLRTLYQEANARREGPAAEGADLERLSALAAGRLAESEALPLLDEVMSDPAMRREFELLRAVHEAGGSTGTAAPRWTARRWTLLAAAVLVVAVLPATWSALRGPEERAAVRGGSERLVLLAPGEESKGGDAVTFAWRPVPGAVRYRLEVVDATGDVVAEFETADSLATLPAGQLPDEGDLSWTVEAQTPSSVVRAAPRTLRLRLP